MSHTTTIESVTISDIYALKSAVAELKQNGINCELIENATPRAYYNNQSGLEEAPYVLKLEDCQYDVGFYKRQDGSYEARADFWAGHVEKVLGSPAREGESADQARLGKLYQTYAVHAATRKAIEQGYSVNRVVKDDGTIQLVVQV